MGVLHPDSYEDLALWHGVKGNSLIEMASHGVVFIPDFMRLPAHELGHTFGLSRETKLKNWLSFETFPLFTPSAWDEYGEREEENWKYPYTLGRPANGFWASQGGEPSQILSSTAINHPVCNAHGFMGSLDFPALSGPNPGLWNGTNSCTVFRTRHNCGLSHFLRTFFLLTLL